MEEKRNLSQFSLDRLSGFQEAPSVAASLEVQPNGQDAFLAMSAQNSEGGMGFCILAPPKLKKIPLQNLFDDPQVAFSVPIEIKGLGEKIEESISAK